MLEHFKDLMVDSTVICDIFIILFGIVVAVLLVKSNDSNHDLWD